MLSIEKIAQEALTSGYLTLQAEDQLRLLLQGKYSLNDFRAFMELQEAAMAGQVRQESRESKYLQPSFNTKKTPNSLESGVF